MAKKFAPRQADEMVSLQVRLLEGLRQQLAERAKANGRSLNSEIVIRLDRSLTKEMTPQRVGMRWEDLQARKEALRIGLAAAEDIATDEPTPASVEELRAFTNNLLKLLAEEEYLSARVRSTPTTNEESKRLESIRSEQKRLAQLERRIHELERRVARQRRSPDTDKE